MFIHGCVLGQTPEILAKFQIQHLPYCYSYAKNEAISTAEGRKYDQIDSLALSPEVIEKYLTPKQKSNLDQGFKGEYPSRYFAGQRLAEKNSFIVLTYQSLFSPVVECAATFLCTLDKKGNCISNVLIASSLYVGMGRFVDGQQFPYYEDVESCVDENLLIHVKGFGGTTMTYQINEKGEIVQLR